MSTDGALTRQRIAAFSAADAQTWDALLAAFPGQAQHLFALLGSPMKKRAIASILFRLLRSKGIAGTLELGRFLLSSPRTWLEETFESPEVRAMLGAWGMHLDFAPDISGGALFPYLEGMANQSFGMVLGQGGADTMIDALVGLAKGAGASIECAAPVERIEAANGRAGAIVLAAAR